MGLGLYFTATVVYAASRGVYGSLPFLLLFQAGFLYTGILSLRERFELGASRIGKASESASSSPAKTGPRSCLGRLIRRAVSLG